MNISENIVVLVLKNRNNLTLSYSLYIFLIRAALLVSRGFLPLSVSAVESSFGKSHSITDDLNTYKKLK